MPHCREWASGKGREWKKERISWEINSGFWVHPYISRVLKHSVITPRHWDLRWETEATHILGPWGCWSQNIERNQALWVPEVRVPAGVQTRFHVVISKNRLFQGTEPVGLPEEDVPRRCWVTRSTARVVCRRHRHGAAQGNASSSKNAAWPKHFHIASLCQAAALPPCTAGFPMVSVESTR